MATYQVGATIVPIGQRRILTKTVTPKPQDLTAKPSCTAVGARARRPDTGSTTQLALCPQTSPLPSQAAFPSLQIEATGLDHL